MSSSDRSDSKSSAPDQYQRDLDIDQLDQEVQLRKSIMDTANRGIMAFRAVRNDAKEILDFEWLLVNKHAEEMVQMACNELLGSRLLTLMPGNLEDGLFNIYKDVVNSGVSANFSHVYDHENVNKVFFHIIATKLSDGFTVSFEDITRDVEEKARQDALVKQLKSRNGQLREFSQILSHNVRNPVSNLNILLELIHQADTEEDRMEIIEQLGLVSESLNTLLEDLLETIKVFDDRELHLEPLELEDIISTTKKVLQIDIETSGAKISSELDWKQIDYNRLYLRSIMMNLVSNALKYRSPDRPCSITIRAFNVGGKKVLEVQDNGLGIDLSRYGRRMFGLQNRFHRGIEGKGIGLFMTKTQIESLGGSISVESEVGKGTIFRIDF